MVTPKYYQPTFKEVLLDLDDSYRNAKNEKVIEYHLRSKLGSIMFEDWIYLFIIQNVSGLTMNQPMPVFSLHCLITDGEVATLKRIKDNYNDVYAYALHAIYYKRNTLTPHNRDLRLTQLVQVPLYDFNKLVKVSHDTDYMPRVNDYYTKLTSVLDSLFLETQVNTVTSNIKDKHDEVLFF